MLLMLVPGSATGAAVQALSTAMLAPLTTVFVPMSKLAKLSLESELLWTGLGGWPAVDRCGDPEGCCTCTL